MAHEDLVYVGHMLDTARLALGKIVGKSRDDFDGDENLRLALTHLVQVIGEAARQVSEPFGQMHPEIPWTKIVGMRHRVVHDYLHVDYDLVWGVVKRDLPPLVKALSRLVSSEGG